MKLTVFLIAFTCFTAYSASYSQQVSISAKNKDLVQVIKQLREQSDYAFVFNTELLKKARPVSIHAQNVELRLVLKEIFNQQPLDFEIRDKTIVIVPKLPPGRHPERNETEPNGSPLQQQPVTGTLTDASGKAVSGATVTHKGGNRKAISNGLGQFSIPAEAGDVLLITSVGFAAREIKVGTNPQLGRLALQASTSDLDEVNVVAYGTSTRRETTGSISTIKGKEIEGIPSPNIANLLQGRVAGMDVTNISGSPGGGGIAITVRGYNSLDVEQGRRFSNPLWVVDGVPLNSFTSPVTGTNMLADINPDMIESIQILKDASSASLYGSRAANGVIIVTTKKGQQNQQAQFSANVSQTYSVLPQLPTVTIGNAERRLRMQAFQNYKKAYIDMDNMRYTYPTSPTDVNRQQKVDTLF